MAKQVCQLQLLSRGLWKCSECGAEWAGADSTAVRRRCPSVTMNRIAAQPVAYVIPCHNYGRYLAECVESVVHQASEVFIVLDDCSDHSEMVARSLRQRYPAKVRYESTRCCNAFHARRLGFLKTSAPIVCFLDADDMVSEDYSKKGSREFAEGVGIVTGEAWQFGSVDWKWKPEPCDLNVRNCVTSAALVSRKALQASGVFDKFSISALQHSEDYAVFREIYNAGWTVKKFDGIHWYRRHRDNKSLGETEKDWIKPFQAAVGYTPPKRMRVGWFSASHEKGVDAGGVGTVVQAHQDYAARCEWHEGLREADVIYAWGLNDQFLEELESIRGSAPIIYAMHITSPAMRMRLPRILAIADRVVGVSEMCRGLVPESEQHRYKTIHVGADLRNLDATQSREMTREAWGITDNAPVIGFVGRWSPEKSPREVAKFAANAGGWAVFATMRMPSREVQREVAAITGDRVVWTNSDMLHLGDIYRGFDALVVPSPAEGGPLVALEAMACGTPVISNPVGILPELQRNHGELWTTLTSDAKQDLKNAAKIVTTTGRELVIGYYNARRMVRDWEQVLCESH